MDRRPSCLAHRRRSPWFTCKAFTATGWDKLDWLLLLLLCAAPAAGIVLAWAVYGFRRLRRKRELRL